MVGQGDTDDANQDFALIDAFMAGDAGAFESLFHKYKRRVFKLIFRFVSNELEAEDLLQDVFVRVYEKLSKFNKSSAFYTWLYRLTVNICLNHTGRGYKKRELLQDDKFVVDKLKPHELAITSLDVDLQEALKTLPSKQRSTFILKVYDDLKFTDIAKIMNCSVGGAKANYFHAVRKLQAKLEVYREL